MTLALVMQTFTFEGHQIRIQKLRKVKSRRKEGNQSFHVILILRVFLATPKMSASKTKVLIVTFVLRACSEQSRLHYPTFPLNCNDALKR